MFLCDFCHFGIQIGYAKLRDSKDLWHSCEKKWSDYNADDAIEWFKFVLNMQNGSNGDCVIADYSGSETSDSGDGDEDENDHELDDEKTQELNEEIDFQDIKSHLLSIHFKSKRDLPMLSKTFHFKRLVLKIKIIVAFYIDQVLYYLKDKENLDLVRISNTLANDPICWCIKKWWDDGTSLL